MRRILTLFIVLFTVNFTQASATQYLSFTGGYGDSTVFNVERKITKYDSYYEIKYDIAGGYVFDKVHDNQSYRWIELENGLLSNEKGNPQLPVYSDLFIVDSSTVKVDIVKSDYKEFSGFTISPALGYQLGTEDKDSTYTFSKVYTQNEYFPENCLSVRGNYQYRDIPYVNIQVNPVQYNPVTKTIRCYKNITYRVYVNNLKWNNTKDYNELTKLVEDYDVIDSTTIKRPQYAASSNVASLKTKSDYLIVTVDSFLPAVNKFVKWKSQLGYKCRVLSTSSSWSNPTLLTTCIRMIYSVDKPTYLLIVGGNNHVKSHTLTNGSIVYVSDLPFTTISSNSFLTPDLISGRLLVNNLKEANLVVDKIINYEKNPVEDASFYNSAVHVTNVEDNDKDGFEDGRFLRTSEEIRDYMEGWGKSVTRMYNYSGNKPSYYNPMAYCNGSAIPEELLNDNDAWGGSSADIQDELSKGQFYAMYNSHGNVRIWGSKNGDYFYNYRAQNLTNGNRLPVLFSISCLTGKFNETSCMAESFLTAQNGGAVGVVAATEVSTFLWNDLFAEGIFNTLFPSPGIQGVWGSYQTPGWKVVEYAKEKNPEYHMGKVMRNGLFRMYKMLPSDNDSCAMYTCREYHYFGDPSMEIYTAVPQCITPAIVENGSKVTVSTGLSGCRIALSSATDNGASYMAVAENTSSAVFENVSSPYTVTITKHNYKPYISGAKLAFIHDDTITKNVDVYGDFIYAGTYLGKTKEESNVMVTTGSLNLQATTKIILKSGFSTNGGTLLAHIGEYNCDFPNSTTPSYSPSYKPLASIETSDVAEDSVIEDDVLYVENGVLWLKLNCPQDVIITDVLGRIVYEQNNLVEGGVPLSKGLYLVKYGTNYTKILVKD